MQLTISEAIKQGLLRDGVTPYSNVDPIAAAEQVMQGRFVFPYVGELSVQVAGRINWEIEFIDNKASKDLWFYSFIFLDYLVKAYVVKNEPAYWVRALEYYVDYHNWKQTNLNAQVRFFNDEHAVSNRSLIISQLLHVANRNGYSHLTEMFVKDLAEHADWLACDEHYVNNNHGVMMDRALLNIFVQFRDIDVSRWFDVVNAKSWLDKALSRLNVMIGKTFDSNGCCTENSPSYHMLNLSLFGAIDAFLRKHGIENASFNSILKRALDVANFMIHEDGSLPLIGDSEKKASVYVSESLNKGKYGIGYFPESGFSVIKEKGFYLSFKCGGSSFSHRHIDDTSVTLRLEGLDFICDAGMYNYESGNKLRRYFVSHNAHSGFFPSSSSNLRFTDFDSPDLLAKTLFMTDTLNNVSIMGESYYEKDCAFSRRIDCLKKDGSSFRKVIMSDAFSSEKPVKWLIQYLLHPEVLAEFIGNGILLKHGDKSIFMSFSANCNFETNIQKGHYSDRYLTASETSMLVFSGESQSLNASTIIVL